MSNEAFLDILVQELEPVRPLGNRGTATSLALFAILAMLGVAATIGIREDVAALAPHPMWLLRSGILLLLGGICAAAVLAMARPGVGRASSSWQVALAMAATVPVAALGFAFSDPATAAKDIWWASVPWCLGVSLAMASGFGAILTLHLRRGAPVFPERAATVTGIAAGSLGVLLYSLHCPSNSIVYTGLWYTLAIAIAALAARLILPPLIRW